MKKISIILKESKNSIEFASANTSLSTFNETLTKFNFKPVFSFKQRGTEPFSKELKNLSVEENIMLRSYSVEVNDDELKKTIEELQKTNLFEDVREDQEVELYFVPNDPLYGQLWGHNTVNASQAWDISRGENVLVSICDTGIDRTHNDLNDNVASIFGHDFSTPDNDPSDYHGHGTHVAGTSSGEGNNATGILGIAFKSKIMAAKVFPNATYDVCADAIRYSADNGAKVVNCSWGPNTTNPVPVSPTLKAAIDYAYNKGTYCVFAAGNKNIDCSTQFPANYDKVITVAATDSNNQKANFSNYGAVCDIAAPGVNILSTKMGGGYTTMAGTSMSAPHVTGAIALISSLASKLSFKNLMYFLKKSAKPLSTTQFIGDLLDCYKLIKPFLITAKRQSIVNTNNKYFSVTTNGGLAYQFWQASSWQTITINTWGPSVVAGSLISIGGGFIAGVNKAGNMIVTWDNPNSPTFAIVQETFGLIPGTLRFSTTKSAIFGLNVFNDVVYIKYHNNQWNMDIIPVWGGNIIPYSIELGDQNDQFLAVNVSGRIAQTWNDPNGTLLCDGTKLSFATLPSIINFSA